MVFYLMFKLF